MTCKSCSPCCAPMFLRIALGVVFVWAGLIKVCGTMPMKGEDAASLANMGVIAPPAKVVAPPAKSSKPDSAPADAPKSQGAVTLPAAPTTQTSLNTQPAILLVSAPRPGPKVYTAEDFPDEVQVKPLYSIAVMLKKAAATTDAEGKPVKAIWPAMLAKDRYPVYLAWCCTLTELVGGAFVLLGFITRLSAFALAFNMGVAMWLTQFGAAIASGNTRLGFLPSHDWLDGLAWMGFNYQMVLLLASLALVALGAGRASLDRVVFPPPAPLTPPKSKAENDAED